MKRVFLDLEMNDVAKDRKGLCPKSRKEIIEIGAVMLDEDDVIIDTFKHYIRPVMNNRISRPIQALTHITTDMVKDAEYIEEIMQKFVDWCGDDCEIYSWSDSDLCQIKQEFAAKKIPISGKMNDLIKHWVDYQKVFSKMCRMNRALRLEDAVRLVGLDFSGSAHDALADAMNTAQIYIHGKTADLNHVHELLHDTFSEHSFSMGDLFDFASLSLVG